MEVGSGISRRYLTGRDSTMCILSVCLQHTIENANFRKGLA